MIEHAEVRELHVTPISANSRYADLVQHLAPGPEIGRQQGHPLADIEHRYRFKTPKGNTLELTLQEITFADDPNRVGHLGGLTLKKIAVGKRSVQSSIPAGSKDRHTRLQATLQQHLLVGRRKAAEGRTLADTIDFEVAFVEKSGQKGCVFRTVTRRDFWMRASGP